MSFCVFRDVFGGVSEAYGTDGDVYESYFCVEV